MGSASPPAPPIGGRIRNAGRAPTVSVGGGNSGGTARHRQLGVGIGYHPDRVQRLQANDGVYLTEGGHNN